MPQIWVRFVMVALFFASMGTGKAAAGIDDPFIALALRLDPNAKITHTLTNGVPAIEAVGITKASAQEVIEIYSACFRKSHSTLVTAPNELQASGVVMAGGMVAGLQKTIIITADEQETISGFHVISQQAQPVELTGSLLLHHPELFHLAKQFLLNREYLPVDGNAVAHLIFESPLPPALAIATAVKTLGESGWKPVGAAPSTEQEPSLTLENPACEKCSLRIHAIPAKPPAQAAVFLQIRQSPGR